jgi:hypothetical protein
MADAGVVAAILFVLLLCAGGILVWHLRNHEKDVKLRALGMVIGNSCNSVQANPVSAGSGEYSYVSPAYSGNYRSSTTSGTFGSGPSYSSSMAAGTYHARGSSHSRSSRNYSYSHAPTHAHGRSPRGGAGMPPPPPHPPPPPPPPPPSPPHPLPQGRAPGQVGHHRAESLEAFRRGFALAELRLATANFGAHMKLAEGNTGAVFRGELPGGTTVAVKMLKPRESLPAGTSGTSGTFRTDDADEFLGAGAFRKELAVLTEHRHINIIAMLGHCLSEVATAPQCLVLEFMEGGSLEERLEAWRVSNKERKKMKKAVGGSRVAALPAPQRFAIASDVARGLRYLHAEANPPIIHQDIKSANILLCTHRDGRLLAKVGDFGTARYNPTRLRRGTAGTHHETENVVGTMPYMPPEVRSFKLFSACVSTTGTTLAAWFRCSECPH